MNFLIRYTYFINSWLILRSVHSRTQIKLDIPVCLKLKKFTKRFPPESSLLNIIFPNIVALSIFSLVRNVSLPIHAFIPQICHLVATDYSQYLHYYDYCCYINSWKTARGKYLVKYPTMYEMNGHSSFCKAYYQAIFQYQVFSSIILHKLLQFHYIFIKTPFSTSFYADRKMPT